MMMMRLRLRRKKCTHEETDDDEDEETDDEEATMNVDDNKQPWGEEDFNEDVKSAIANVREEVEKIQEMPQVK